MRPWNGSQAGGFEELCCQLAESEVTPAGSQFFRKGTPDAGVECFWSLPNGDEWAWQAKYFLQTLNSKRWGEVDDSVRTAIAKHRRLKKYVICFPIDLSDARQPGQISAADRWNERIVKWQRWAKAAKMSVKFEHWGAHEIGMRVSQEPHRGRHWFWFNAEQLTLKWFRRRLDEAIENAHDRYTPEVHVDLPLSDAFDAIGRTPLFINRIRAQSQKVSSAFRKCRMPTGVTNCDAEYAALHSLSRQLSDLVNAAFPTVAEYEPSVGCEKFPAEKLTKFSARLNELAWNLGETLDDTRRRLKEEGSPEKFKLSTNNLENEAYLLRSAAQAASAFESLVGRASCKLLDCPALLVVGDAGQGKTHILCNIAERDMQAGVPRVLLHGGHFTLDEPWSQIIKLLGLTCNKDEFVGALEAAAQATRSRLLLFIDALNEGDGRMLWSNHLAGFLTAIARSPWLGVVLTVRSSYENIIVPPGVVPGRLIRIVHSGFTGREIKASQRFFEHYGIQPTTPLLVPEFSNPLFLKLLCRGLQSAGHHQIPTGLRGITKVMDFFLDTANTKLAARLDYDPARPLVRAAVAALADRMVVEQSEFLARETAQSITESLHGSHGFLNSLFHGLVAEGVLHEDLWNVGGDRKEAVRFSYQRLSDHLIAARLLDIHLIQTNPKRSFNKRTHLGKLCRDKAACWRNLGLIEAFSIQIPERVKQEFVDVAPHTRELEVVQQAFLSSFIWRAVDAFTDGSRACVNSILRGNRVGRRDVINTFVTVAPVPGHPYNAERLHAHLSQMKMPVRDAWWTMILHVEWGEERAVDRIVEWAASPNDKQAIPDDILWLSGIVLAWFLTSSNRFLRDRSTKALVRLFEGRIDCLRRLLHEFRNVDDPYVVERLLAVAYGCAMRTDCPAAATRLAEDVYAWIFENDSPPPHILLRDYARGVIELALHRGAKINVNPQKVRPPYHSEWPALEIPTEESLKKWGNYREGMADTELARFHLYDSVMNRAMADFACYVIGDLDEWSSERLDGPRQQTSAERFDAFADSLSLPQKTALDQFIHLRKLANSQRLARLMSVDLDGLLLSDALTDSELEMRVKEAQSKLTGTLKTNADLQRVFDETVTPYITNPTTFNPECAFDAGMARCWIMQRIIEIGWTVERFGQFDRDVNRYSSHGREAHKAERIGKKYQWIALHELLARLSDNFRMRSRGTDRGGAIFQGPWSTRVGRDIDPSCLVTQSENSQWTTHPPTWWLPVQFDNWSEGKDDVAWLRLLQGLPSVEAMLDVSNPHDGSQWIVLSTYCHWKQTARHGEEREEYPYRRVWYDIQGYICQSRNLTRAFAWAKKQDFWNRWMPESHGADDVFLGEHFWAPSFHAWENHDGPVRDWTRDRNKRLPCDVVVADRSYSWSAQGFDCSTTDSVSISLPSNFLADGMALRWGGKEGHFNDIDGRLICFDPSVDTAGPGALLVRKEPFLQFLRDRGLGIFWTILGEKQVISGSLSRELYPGHTKINGAYRVSRDRVTGSTRCRFEPPYGK